MMLDSNKLINRSYLLNRVLIDAQKFALTYVQDVLQLQFFLQMLTYVVFGAEFD